MARYLNRSYWENRTELQVKPVQYNNYAPPNVYLYNVLIIIDVN